VNGGREVEERIREAKVWPQNVVDGERQELTLKLVYRVRQKVFLGCGLNVRKKPGQHFAVVKKFRKYFLK
jgi:hypothetical protein